MAIKQLKKEVLEQQQKLTNTIAEVLKSVERRVDAAEAAMNQSTGINVSTRLGETENVEFNSDGALSITVYQNQRKGSASTNDLSADAIAQTIDMAINIMQYTSSDPYSGLGDADQMAFNPPDLDLFHPSSLDVEYAIEQAKLAEQMALAHPNISSSDGADFSSQYGIQVYGNSHGMLQGFCASSHSLSCTVIGERQGKMERNYAYTSSRVLQDLASPKWVGEEAAKRTVAHLGARKVRTIKTPVLFSAEVAVGLIGHLASAINGGAIYRKSSFLLDSIGKSIFPEWLSITEDPHVLRGMGSLPFDREGTQTVKRTIVDEGALQTYLMGHYSAKKLGLKSTGHSGGIYNWFVSASEEGDDFLSMVKRLDKGIVITSLMGQGVNNVTGDYSRGASGFWVENGKIQYPINEFTIAGNLKEMYANIVAIGCDIERRTKIQCGSILIDNMSIAGA